MKKNKKLSGCLDQSPSLPQIINRKFIKNFTKRGLLKKLNGLLDYPIYYYIIRSVGTTNGKFYQSGSGPNLEGNFITLTTCKHYMRTYPNINRKVWIAGITSKSIGDNDGNYLFYLALIDKVYADQYGLWNYIRRIDSSTLEIKSAEKNRLGDIFIPKKKRLNSEERLNPKYYNRPIKNHSHKKTWKNDIDSGYKKPSKLLLFNPDSSFVWNKPIIQMKEHKLTQGQRMRETIHDFFDLMR